MASEPRLEAIAVQRLTDAAYQALKENILRQTLRAGQRLNVDELASQLGMSRTPVKDALNALASEGLVEILPRRGTFVIGVTAQDVAEAFEVRRALELLAAELLVARLTDEDLMALRAALARLDEVADGDAVEHMQRNMAFHRLFVRLAGNRRLSEIYENLDVHIQIARVHARGDRWRERRTRERTEHLAIFRALEVRDAARLARAIDAHIRRAKESLIEDLTSAPRAS